MPKNEQNNSDNIETSIQSSVNNGGEFSMETLFEEKMEEANERVEKEKSISNQDVEKKYAESSREALVLKTQVDEKDERIKILNEQLVNQNNVNQQILQNQNAQKQQLERKEPRDIFSILNIDKDNFVYSGEEAIMNPGSDSAKLSKANTTMLIAEALREHDGQTQERVRSNSLNQEKLKFMQDHNMTEVEFNNWYNTQGANVQPTLENIYELTNSKETKEKITNNALDDIKTKRESMKKVHNPSSLENSNSEKKPNVQKNFLNMIENADGGGFNVDKL